MSDPIDDFFNIENSKIQMGDVEKQAIMSDVELVRTAMRDAITKGTSTLPVLVTLASSSQDPDLIDSCSKFFTALSKVSTDLINIDLKVLAEGNKSKTNDAGVIEPDKKLSDNVLFIGKSSDVLDMLIKREKERDVKEDEDEEI